MKNAPTLLALTGLAGAGKSTVAGLLQSRGWKSIYFGGFVLNHLQAQGQSPTPQAEKNATKTLRQQYGLDALARLALPTIRALLQTESGLCLDAVCSFEEYETLQAQLPTANLVLVEVYAEKALRHRRLAERSHRPFSAAAAEERDRHEIITLNKGAALAFSAYKLSNNHTKHHLSAVLAALLEKIFHPPHPTHP